MAPPRSRRRQNVAKNADPALKRLDALVGRWDLDGRFEDEPDIVMTGWEAYEWLDGGHFMVVRWDSDTSGHRNGGIMVVSYDGERDVCVARYYDNEGSTRTFDLDVVAGVYTMTGEQYRYKGSFNEAGDVITGTWEQRDHGSEWEYFYDLTFSRTK